MKIGDLSVLMNISANSSKKEGLSNNSSTSFSGAINKEASKLETNSKESTSSIITADNEKVKLNETINNSLDDNKLNNFKEKLESLNDAVENEDESKIIEELAALLQMLNINVVESANLPIVIEFSDEIMVNTDLANFDMFAGMVLTEESYKNPQIMENILLEETKVIENLLVKDEVSTKILENIVANVETNDGKKLEINDLVNVINNKITEVQGEESTSVPITKMVFTELKSAENVENEEDILFKIINEDNNLQLNKEVASEKEGISIEYGILENPLKNLQDAQNINSQVISKPTPVNEATMARDIITNIKFMTTNNVQELTVKIYPEELGEVTIKLLSEDGIMRADIKATSIENLLVKDEVSTKILENIVANVETNDGKKLEINDLVNVINNKITEVQGEESTSVPITKMVFTELKSAENVENEEDILFKIINEDNNLQLNKEVASEKEGISIEYGILENPLKNLQDAQNINSQVISKPTPVNEATMARDIITNIKFMTTNNVQELTVKIYPEELGEVTIKLLSEDGIMRADIKATSKETYLLLNTNIDEIKKTLSNENIQIKEVNIALYNEDTTYFSGQGFEGSFNQNRNSEMINVEKIEGVEELEEALDVIESNDSNINLFA